MSYKPHLMEERDLNIGRKIEKKSLNALVIHPAIEPGVIDDAMLTRCILENGPTDEAGRLFAEEGVHLDESTVVRLEFQNILRIDHLWVLQALTKLSLAHNLIEKINNLHLLVGLNELDLSFNKIEKIENLECLVDLEILSLFHNKIRKLENLDALTKLIVFSIGDNLIEDYKEMVIGMLTYRTGAEFTELSNNNFQLEYLMAYLRRFRFLRAVSFKGNPCCDDPAANQFLKSALVKVTSLDYHTITEEDREQGRAVFRGLLRKLDEADEVSEKARIAKEEYDARVEFYGISFVEYLSGPELIETMFANDEDGSLLLNVGGDLKLYYAAYKEQYVYTMDEFVEYAQKAYTDRQNEIKLFKVLIEGALADNVRESKLVISEFDERKAPFIAQMKEHIQKFTEKKATLEQLEPLIVDLGETFNDLLYEIWKKLMVLEMNLFEQCEESRTQFSVNMTEKISKLLEHSRNAFGAWREAETVWSSRQFETLSKLLGNKIMLGDVPQELFEVMMDRDAMVNLVAASSDNHMRFIDAREDVLVTRAKDWMAKLVEETNDNEVKRNRDRILEINYFIDNQREDWTDMQMSITDALDREAAALLGDDY